MTFEENFKWFVRLVSDKLKTTQLRRKQIFVFFVRFLFTKLLINVPFMCEEKCFIKSVCQSKGWSTKRICKEFLIKKWAVSFIEDQCKAEKTNSVEWKTGAERPQTTRSEQNHKHVTELICNREGNPGSSRSPWEIKNLPALSLGCGCSEKLSWTQTHYC